MIITGDNLRSEIEKMGKVGWWKASFCTQDDWPGLTSHFDHETGNHMSHMSCISVITTLVKNKKKINKEIFVLQIYKHCIYFANITIKMIIKNWWKIVIPVLCVRIFLTILLIFQNITFNTSKNGTNYKESIMKIIKTCKIIIRINIEASKQLKYDC